MTGVLATFREQLASYVYAVFIVYTLLIIAYILSSLFFAFGGRVPYSRWVNAVLSFLREVVRPTYRQAGWRLRRVLTDNGKEFKGVFAAGCEGLQLRVTKTKPRHAWTNGFVERLQKTILHEHWRIAFRRQYFTSRRSLQGTLDRFMHFYNHERTHRGYRLNGRTPATIFNGAVAA